MKKARAVLALAVLAAFLTRPGVAIKAGASEEETAEWTVLFYFCGADLESRYSYATGNLKEIAMVTYPDSFLELYTGEHVDMAPRGKVNVLHFLEYEIVDIFMRSTVLERIEIHWDGETMSFPEGFTWEGH